ncbi:phytanoyl-CoA dioxygenase family protein [Armatimonas sp.]|uniref:phytanoyl-CoA dioxygenase family protein n=1 Tax=Armatimonas sp. TaxID=1872638 RepID=UPI003750F9DB
MPFSLNSAEVAQFHELGYLGPFTLYPPDEMAVIRTRIESEVLTTDGPNPKSRLQCRHLDQRFLYDLCVHPAILDRAESLFGPDLVLWATYFFNKEPGGSEIPWHQDFNYWPLEPVVNLSAWLAIDPVTIENSCVNLIPGSHKKLIHHVPSRDGMAFGEEADPAQVDATKAIPMELAPGQFFLFNERTLHQSNKNISQKRRMGMTLRITVPFVKVTHDIAPLFPGHANIQLRGTDKLGFNRLVAPPEANP